MSNDSDGGEVYGSIGPAQAPGRHVKGCKGHTGQITNVGAWVMAFIVVVGGTYVAQVEPYPINKVGGVIALLAIAYAFYRYLAANCDTFDVGAEQLETRRGVLSKISNNLQLYRVKDIQVREPFIYRLLGRGNVVLKTSDYSSPELELRAIKKPHDVAEVVRKNTEVERLRKNVREVD